MCCDLYFSGVFSFTLNQLTYSVHLPDLGRNKILLIFFSFQYITAGTFEKHKLHCRFSGLTEECLLNLKSNVQEDVQKKWLVALCVASFTCMKCATEIKVLNVWLTLSWERGCEPEHCLGLDKSCAKSHKRIGDYSVTATADLTGSALL